MVERVKRFREVVQANAPGGQERFGGTGVCAALFVFPLVPANARLGHAIGRGKIRLDIDKRRTVQAVETDDGEPGTIDAQQLDHTPGARTRLIGGMSGLRT